VRRPPTIRRACVACLFLCLTVSAPAQASTAPATTPTSAAIAPSLSPDRPGAKAMLDLGITYSGGAQGVPTPVRKSVLQLPAGLTLDVPRLRSCRGAVLRADGPRACPPQSRIGGGQALAEVHAGSQLLTEHVALFAFLGPPRKDRPTFEILGEGRTPLHERVLLSGVALPDAAPYGEELVLSIPPIPTLPLEPDASLRKLSLRIGARPTRGHAKTANSVLVPSHCPPSGLPFAASFRYADGSSGSATATVPCEGTSSSVAQPAAHGARTVAFTEVGHLRATAKHEFTLVEQGPASGTFAGTIYVRLTLVSTSRATAEIRIVHGGGSITAHATASYKRSRSSASFSGTMSITGGSGAYAHVHGSGLHFGGTMQQSNDALTVQMSGGISD
jgi:hypothetical protein